MGVEALEDVLAHLPPCNRDELERLTLGDVSYHQEFRRTLQMEEAALGLPTLLAAVNTEGDPQVKLLKDRG